LNFELFGAKTEGIVLDMPAAAMHPQQTGATAVLQCERRLAKFVDSVMFCTASSMPLMPIHSCRYNNNILSPNLPLERVKICLHFCDSTELN